MLRKNYLIIQFHVIIKQVKNSKLKTLVRIRVNTSALEALQNYEKK